MMVCDQTRAIFDAESARRDDLALLYRHQVRILGVQSDEVREAALENGSVNE